jgi:hypothetical protein
MFILTCPALLIWMIIPYLIFTVALKDLEPMEFRSYDRYQRMRYEGAIQAMREIKRVWSNQ